MANVTITYNPKAGGRARITTGLLTDAMRRTYRKGGFMFADGANVGFYVPGARSSHKVVQSSAAAFSGIVAAVSAIHSDTLTLTESTTGFYDDGPGSKA